MSSESDGVISHRLSVLDVARVPHPGRTTVSRRTTRFTPDGKLVFLCSPQGSMHRQLMSLDLSAVASDRGSKPQLMRLPQHNGPGPERETLQEQ
eukprot:CAMPEP_0177593910 /NCGR_PEP_ID=MMETSP0419_2-20121207/9466_1 /TAXON_ID=582737 /ORGANISM="Tetraselmis sp., Strain GSL018" /LENGTH=93 /DNA_ID=CAMNT_0019085117 /DNA_START=182 /DNA_END=460 /DNA_ORIENTATION=+